MANPTLPRIAVVGCGQWGINLVRCFSQLGALHTVSDVDTKHAAEVAEQYGVTSRDWISILNDKTIAAVVLATPAENHAQMAIEAFAAGKDVYIEKPLALTVNDGLKILAAANKSGKIGMVGHLCQYHPAYAKLRALIQDGRLGHIQYIHSTRLAFGRIRHEENALWSLAPHDISIILGITGQEPVSIEAQADYLLRTHIADSADVKLNFANGVQARISVSWMYPHKERRLFVIGEKAMAILNDCEAWENKLSLYDQKVTWENGLPRATKGSVTSVVVEEAEPLMEECRHFLQCMSTGRQPLTSLDEGLKVLRVLSAADEAMGQSNEATLKEQQQPRLLQSSEQIHGTAVIDEDCHIGPKTRIWHFSHIMSGTRIGQSCTIGQNVMIGAHVHIGDNCKIQNNVSIYKGVQLGDGVFCGPSCVFTNVLHPRAEIERKSEFVPTIVRRGATIGANATIICGNELGEYCMVGAGAVVTKPVLPYALVVGNPARQIGWVSTAGETLGTDLQCPRTGQRFQLDTPTRLVPLRSDDQQSAIANAPILFFDLKVQRSRLGERLDRRIQNVLRNADFIMGPEVLELEKQLATFTGAAHAITCANGTDALQLALMALGVGPGQAVLVPASSFVASVEPVVLLGAVIIFIDIDAQTFTINPALLEAGIKTAHDAGHKPTGIIAVDLYGQPVDYDALNAVADRHGLWVVADAAQSFGASYKGRRVGTLAKITTTSFFPAKPLGCYGDGGAIFTDDPDIAATLCSLRVHGRGEDKFDNVRVGLNSRLDTLQAAVLLAKLELFEDELASRQAIALRYEKRLKGAIKVPILRELTRSAWASYTICSSQRDLLQRHLTKCGVPTAIYYPRPLHRQVAYQDYPVIEGGCPVAEQATATILSLPMYPYLDEAMQERIIAAVNSFEENIAPLRLIAMGA
jgi:UDP-2-acetamido-3-amino-2,3-dideoxy-glucuronate N-acetyltransferase